MELFMTLRVSIFRFHNSSHCKNKGAAKKWKRKKFKNGRRRNGTPHSTAPPTYKLHNFVFLLFLPSKKGFVQTLGQKLNDDCRPTNYTLQIVTN